MKKRNILLFFRYTVILTFAVTMIVPFFWMIITSFKEPTKVFTRPINWWVDSFDFKNYTIFLNGLWR